MNRLFNQLTLGLWGAMALGFSVMSKSWSTLLNLAAVGLFFAVGTWASSSLKDGRPGVRRLAIALSCFFFGVILFGFISTVERLYLVNGATYPAWLAKRDLGTLPQDALMRFTGGPDCKGGAEIFDKEDGNSVIRCGGFLWYESKTYTVQIQRQKGGVL